ncbi:hypothetical protein HYW19_03630, partial [Candidatus Woesearchaeota archaeon]|nr:hypothetical protein [Candidatus Woesearchaeota archaeon]
MVQAHNTCSGDCGHGLNDWISCCGCNYCSGTNVVNDCEICWIDGDGGHSSCYDSGTDPHQTCDGCSGGSCCVETWTCSDDTHKRHTTTSCGTDYFECVGQYCIDYGSNDVRCIGCRPNCAGKVCGGDGCTGSCGTCSTGYTCSNGQCVSSGCTNGATQDCGGGNCGSKTCSSGSWGNCNLKSGNACYSGDTTTSGCSGGQFKTCSSCQWGSCVSCISAPTLSSPSNGAYLPGTQVTLSWNAVAGATSYNVRVDDGNSAADTSDIVGGTANNCGAGVTHDVCYNGWTSTSMTVTVQAGSSYSWWVHATKSCGTSSASSIWSFTVDRKPIGYLSGADCSTLTGWACDKDSPDSALQVDFYEGSTYLGLARTGTVWGGTAAACGSSNNNHGYSFAVPGNLTNDASHSIGAYGINIDNSGARYNAGGHTTLTGSPKSITCPNNAPTASITGPTSFFISSGSASGSYTATASDANGNLNKIGIYMTPINTQTWPTQLETTDVSTGSYTNTVTFNAAGTYWVVTNAYDAGGKKCTGNPGCTVNGGALTCSGWSDCGSNDALTVTVTSDTTLPQSGIIINSGDSKTASSSVTLTLTYSDAGSGIKDCRYSNDASTWSAWESCSATKAWTLSSGDGTKTVYYEVRDNTNNVRQTNDGIEKVTCSGYTVGSVCDTVCGANLACQGKAPDSDFLSCNVAGQTYYQDKCSSTCQPIDRDSVCRSSAYYSTCTAVSDCNGYSSSSCTGSGFCSSSCQYTANADNTNNCDNTYANGCARSTGSYNSCDLSTDISCGTETACSDVKDNDCDSLTDCADPDCAGLSGPSGVTCCQTATLDSNCGNDDCKIESCTSNNCVIT